MAQDPSSTRTVRVPIPAPASDADYDVQVGPGLLAELPEMLASTCPAFRYALIADSRVAVQYGEPVVERLRRAEVRVDLFAFPEGEANKTRESWADLSDRMFAAGIGRDAVVLALGGGVTGDLAGFVAATYMRGLPLVQLPTSLLAMIDSSVGGKTGVDTPTGKNLIGAFLQPSVVVADTEVLRTLAPEHLRAGLAEAIKHGCIADRDYFRWIEAALPAILALEEEALSHLIARSVEIKADFVGRDEKEAGPRKMLNFGHTVGHSVEALSGFRVLHGEAVAIGMVVEAELGERIGATEAGTTDRIRDVLVRAGLPVRVPAGMEAAQIVAGARSDKKARMGKVEYSLIERIGQASPGPDGKWGWAVDEETVAAVLAS